MPDIRKPQQPEHPDITRRREELTAEWHKALVVKEANNTDEGKKLLNIIYKQFNGVPTIDKMGGKDVDVETRQTLTIQRVGAHSVTLWLQHAIEIANMSLTQFLESNGIHKTHEPEKE